MLVSFVWSLLTIQPTGALCNYSCTTALFHHYPLQYLCADGLKGKTLSSDAQSRFVELLLYTPILDTAELMQLAALLRTGSLSGSSAKYLLHLVDQR